LLSSFYWDTPVGASIVVVAALLFVLAQAMTYALRRN